MKKTNLVFVFLLIASNAYSQPSEKTPPDDPKKASHPYKNPTQKNATAAVGLDKGETKKQESASQQRDEDRKLQIEALEVSKRLGIYTFWLAIFTCVLGGAAIWQVLIARNTAKRQLRAYVSVRGARVGGDADRPFFDVEAVNCGQSPAHEMTAWIGSAYRDFPLKEKLKPLESPDYKQSLGPSVPCILHKSLKRAFTKEERGQLAAGTHALYIFGRCDYLDIFDEPHFTNFCFAYREGPTECLGLKRYKDGNDAN